MDTMDTKLNRRPNCCAGKHQPRAAVPAPSLNCSRANSDQYRFWPKVVRLRKHVLHCGQPHSELSVSTFVRARPLVVDLGPPARKRPPRKRVKNSNANENKQLISPSITENAVYAANFAP